MSKEDKSTEYAKFKQYDYRSNSTLVLQSATRVRITDPSGEPETLRGKQLHKMGDKFERSKPQKSDNAKKAKKSKDIGSQSFKRNQNILSSTFDFTSDQALYQPKTEESLIAYESLLNFVQPFLGDVSPDVLREVAYEILSTLKDEQLNDPERYQDIKALLKSLVEEDYAKLVQIGKSISDFSTSTEDTLDEEGNLIQNKRTEEQAISVVFNEAEGDDEEPMEDTNVVAESDEEEDAEGEEALATTTLSSKISSLDDVSDNHGMWTASTSSDAFNLHPSLIDAYWLQRELSHFYKDANESQQKDNEILQILADRDDDCETRLLLLLGEEKFKFILKLMRNRWKIVYCTKWHRARNENERSKIEEQMRESAELKNILEQLLDEDDKSTKVESSKKKRKTVKKEEQPLDESDAMDVDDQEKSADSVKKVLDLDSLAFEQGAHFMANKSCELPEGSKRIQYKGYEQVIIPGKQKTASPDEITISKSQIPHWAQAAFPNLKELNRIQSKVYKIALFSPENMLLCAPTGSGKTNVAVLTILHELGLHMNEDGSKIVDKDFKIVYVAPMKALVQEVVGNLKDRFEPYGISIQELSGDRNMTKQQISETQIIVTTPEKWDIVTRKSGDRSYVQQVRLIIIDEVHLLHDDRGPVLESIVARTIRQQESTQENIRIVGLSATLPNYEDVATFLRVKPEGLFFFDNTYRPTILQQQYIGITERKALKRLQVMNEVTYDRVMEKAGKKQILIFVHSRKETVKTAKAIRDMAIEKDSIGKFLREGSASRAILNEEVENTKNADLKDLLPYGFAIHHAGLSRADRTLVEDLFADEHIQVLVSTATLAWGVNLPAHTVIIKGTQVYNPEKSRWMELSPLDVMQMIGRAGRPQFEKEGEGILITGHPELQYYLSLLNHQLPIESQFLKRLADHLNAEVVLGTVRNFQEAIDWLSYTYLYIRMIKNPNLYGIDLEEAENDKTLEKRKMDLIHSASILLEKHGLCKYDKKSGLLEPTELGRVSSHYYISYKSIATYNEHLKPSMSDIELFRLFSLSEEFSNMMVRQEEKLELQKLIQSVPIPIKEGVEDASAKVNVLLQAHISRLKLEGFALMSDMTYVTQSAARIVRALFEISLKRGWAQLTEKTLNLAKMIEQQLWAIRSPLHQFKTIAKDTVKQIERKDLDWESLYDLTPAELGDLVRFPAMGKVLHRHIQQFPRMDVTAHVQPITRSMLRIDATLVPDFKYNESIHGPAEAFWVMVVDVDGEVILHVEPFILKKKFAEEEHYLSFTVPIFDPVPPQYFIKIISDKWIGSVTTLPISFRHLILPEKYSPPTELLDLQPLAITALRNEQYQSLFDKKFKYFNPIQTQVFNTVYNTDESMLIAAPTGSGKTVCAELAVLRMLNQFGDKSKCVYVAPLEVLSNHRYKDWKEKFSSLKIGQNSTNITVAQLSGDSIIDTKLCEKSNIIICTPNQWDIISRKWKLKRNVASLVNLFIVDELHFISSTQDVGYTLEIITSRMRLISSKLQNRSIRILGLSTSIANARDVGEWLGASVKRHSLFNFHPKVRPTPLEVKIQSFPQYTFTSRMLAMLKPTYQTLKDNHNKSSVVFVPSKQIARSTALELMTYIASEYQAKDLFLSLEGKDLQTYLDQIDNKSLKHVLQYGVAFCHEHLSDDDRRLVEKLFKSGAIRILISPYEECWTLDDDIIAQTVVIMGTQYYDGQNHRYADYSITDIIQMMGRALDPIGGKCFIYCHGPRKEYYKKFLNEPFPVESRLDQNFADPMNAEIASKTIPSKHEAVNYLTWTFLYRRIRLNPNYYHLHGTTHDHISDYLSELVENTLEELTLSKCVQAISGEEEEVEEERIVPLNLGMIATYYYIKYTTMEIFSSSLTAKTRHRGLIEILSAASEFDANIPIRKKEDDILRRLASHTKLRIDKPKYTDPHTKVNILLQSHFSRTKLNAELEKDKSKILVQSIRLLHAIVDVVSSNLWLFPAIAAMEMCQMIVQAVWDKDSYLLQLPFFTKELAQKCEKEGQIETIFDLIDMDDDKRSKLLGELSESQMNEVARALNRYPNVDVSFELESDEVSAGNPVTVHVQFQLDLGDDDDDEEDAGNNKQSKTLTEPVYAPFYPKAKMEEWWVVIGDPATNTLFTIKRIQIRKKAVGTKLEFILPKETQPGAKTLKLYLMCDSYTGCDQELELNLSVKLAENAESESDEDDDVSADGTDKMEQ